MMLWQDNVRIAFPICAVTFVHIVYAIGGESMSGPSHYHQ